MPHTDSAPGELPQQLLAATSAARHAFLTALDPLRPELYRYCRRLTGNVWDAEDLVQETLTRAFTRAAQSHQAVQRRMAWLARIATNAYLDSLRRPAPLPLDLPERATPAGADPAEVRDALAEVTALLPPQERAALVLKDVFDLPLKEIAAMLNTSEGAVKAALHRGRGRLNEPDRDTARSRRHAPERPVLDALAAAFSAYDLDRLTALFLTDAVSEVTGMVHEVGRDRIDSGSLHHTLYLETDVRWRAEIRELDNEPLVVLWATPTDTSAPEALEDVLRVQTRRRRHQPPALALLLPGNTHRDRRTARRALPDPRLLALTSSTRTSMSAPARSPPATSPHLPRTTNGAVRPRTSTDGPLLCTAAPVTSAPRSRWPAGVGRGSRAYQLAPPRPRDTAWPKGPCPTTTRAAATANSATRKGLRHVSVGPRPRMRHRRPTEPRHRPRPGRHQLPRQRRSADRVTQPPQRKSSTRTL